VRAFLPTLSVEGDGCAGGRIVQARPGRAMEIEAQIQEFVAAEVATDGRKVGADDDLLDSGLLDSTAITMLVSFIEDRFGVEVEDDELVPENFRSINAIGAFLASKTATPQAG